MTVPAMINEAAKLWKSIVTIVGAIGITVAFTMTMLHRVDAGEKKDVSQDKAAAKQDIQIELLTELVRDMKVQVSRIDGNLSLILQMYGYDSSRVRKWKQLPTVPVIDTATGKPTVGFEWLEIHPSHGYYAIASMDSVVGFYISRSIAWDMRTK